MNLMQTCPLKFNTFFNHKHWKKVKFWPLNSEMILEMQTFDGFKMSSEVRDWSSQMAVPDSQSSKGAV